MLKKYGYRMALEAGRGFGFSTSHIVTGREARERLAKSIEKMESCVRLTLGPLGRNVALDYEAGLPKITKDGVTVAKNIFFRDRLEEMGANLLRKVSHSTNIYAGDGTTTATILAKEIISEGIKMIESGLNPIGVKDGINKAKNAVKEYLEAIKCPIASKEELYNVARLSVNYDDELARILSEAIWETGKTGIIHIEPNYMYNTTLVLTEGVTLPRGYASEDFVKEGNTIKVQMDNPYILVVNQELHSVKQVIPILEKVKETKRPLFIVAADINENVMSTLLYNHQRDIVNVCAITVPGKAEFPRELMTDLSIISGARFFDDNELDDLSQCELEHLGTAKKIISNPTETFFIGSGGMSEKINARIKEIKDEMEHKTLRTPQKMLLDERITRLNGKMALILCGGNSDFEIGENRDKIVDALNSLRTAWDNGVLPGGGAALLHSSRILDFLEANTEEEKAGFQILKQALKKPMMVLPHETDFNGRYIVEKILEDYPDNLTGFDLRKGEFCNMIERGVIDSFTVVTNALDDACSVASMILTTEAAIVKDKVYIAPPLSSYAKEPF